VTKARAVVLGAGLMGRMLACSLAERGCQVEVFEAGSSSAPSSAAHLAASMLSPLAESVVSEPGVVQMGAHSLSRWPEVIKRLDLPVYFQQEGTLVVWHRQDSAEANRFAQQMSSKTALMPHLQPVQPVDSQALSRLEPELEDRFASGLFLPDEGQIDNRELLSALLDRMLTLGVHIHWNTPRSLSDAEPHDARWFFDCRGLGARDNWTSLRGVRGEIVRVHAPGVTLRRPIRLLHPRYPLYIAPKPDDLYVIGATELESDDQSPPSVRSLLELMSAAYSVHPGFGEARVLEIASGCRPTLPDNLPALRWVAPRRLQINGLYRHGFLIAPAMVDAVLECMSEGHSALADGWGLKVEHA
jgi:glycine oxidase